MNRIHKKQAVCLCKYLFPVIFTSLLIGCSSMQQVPDLNTRLQVNQEALAQYTVDEAWWQAYHKTELDDLVDFALKNNADLNKSALNINIALYQANLLGADLTPTFSARLNATTIKDIKTSAAASRSFGGEIALNYELDLWRKLANMATAQEWEYKASIEDQAAIKLTLINSVVDAYFNLAYLNGSIDMVTKNIQRYQHLQQLSKLKYQSGKIEAIELAQISQSLLSEQESLIELQTQQKNIEQALRNFLNIEPSKPLDLIYPDLIQLVTPAIDVNVPLSLLARRPDLRAAEYRLQKSLKNLYASEANYYPSITIGAAINSSSNHAHSAFNVPFTNGTLAITLPFLQWNKIKWNVKTSEAEFERSKLEFEEKIITALNEVDTFYFTYTQAKNTLTTSAQKHQQDIKISRYYQARYQSGANELSDWLNALNTENMSRQSLLNQHYQVIKYQNMIYKATAGAVLPNQAK